MKAGVAVQEIVEGVYSDFVEAFAHGSGRSSKQQM